MTHRLGMTGMDAATEAALRSAFEFVQSRLGGDWELAAETDADYVVVDMDSMYGPMSWIRLHAAGKQIIGLTNSPRTQADYRLAMPFDRDSLLKLLSDISGAQPRAGEEHAAAKHAAAKHAAEKPAAREHAATQPAADSPVIDSPPVAPSLAITPAQQPDRSSAAAQPTPLVSTTTASPGEQSAAEPNSDAAAPATTPDEASDRASRRAADQATDSAAQSRPSSEPSQMDLDQMDLATKPDARVADTSAANLPLAQWLRPGALAGRLRLARGEVTVAIDAGARVYRGPALLKPLASLFDGDVSRSDFQPLDDAAWQAANNKATEQPLVRLQWFGALLGGNGALLPGHDPDGQYRLLKWPQTEREFPKHFRIATAMMKGSATVAEITSASGVTQAEVADFINANLATGFAEAVLPQASEPAAAAKPASGLFGRLRGR